MSDAHAIHHPNDLHFLTFTVMDWMDICTRLAHRQSLVDSLNFCIRN